MTQLPPMATPLEEDETVLARRRPVRKSNALLIYGVAMFFLCSAVLWLGLLLHPSVTRGLVTWGMFLFGALGFAVLFVSTERDVRVNRYYVTDRRIIRERDSGTTNSVKYDDIGDLDVSRGFIDRLFGTGSIEVRPFIDSGADPFTLKWVEDVDKLEQLLLRGTARSSLA